MKLLLLLTLISTLTSCGFRDSETADSKNVTNENSQLKASDSYSSDFDGDLVSDGKEKELGRNPIIADLPKLNVRFLQNYTISGNFLNKSTNEINSLEIKTNKSQDDADFNFRVGSLFIRDHAYKNAGKIAKYANHSYTSITEKDFTWVTYPKMPSDFVASAMLSISKFKDQDNYETQELSIEIENSVKLLDTSIYKSIKNLELNFYFYSYETETYELLDTKIIQRVFTPGVNETFTVLLQDIPSHLITNNYLKNGEFIYTEINDYEIPELKTTYKSLLASIRNKSIPVVVNTPLETSLYYVGLNDKSGTFSQVLEAIYEGNYEIQNNELKTINQFQNNLPNYTYLSEIKNLDKKGKWFVLTNQINKDYLDYEFTPKDYLSISYVTGDKLARQIEEEFNSYSSDFRSDSQEKLEVFLGNIKPNSEVNFQIKPEKVFGTTTMVENTYPSSSCSGGGNNICYIFSCHYQINHLNSVEQELNPEEYDYINYLNLNINNQPYPLSGLIKDDKIEFREIGSNLNFRIKDISSIQAISNAEENLLSLSVERKQNVVDEGLKIVSMEGAFCTNLAIQTAGHNGWPLNEHSQHFDSWKGYVNWGAVKLGKRRTIYLDFKSRLTSIISNFHN